MNKFDFDRLEAQPDNETSPEFQKLCHLIVTCVSPNTITEKWKFLGGHNGWLRIDMSPTDFGICMEQDLTGEELVEIGLYEGVEDELRLASRLDGNEDLYVSIDPIHETFAFSTDSGEFLFPRKRTALDYALARNPPDSAQVPITLFIVDSEDAVTVMQRLGLQAVMSEGLESFDCDDVAKMFSGDLRGDFDWQYFLMLVDFDVAGLENRPRATMGELITRLADVQGAYGIDPARRFGVCRPTAYEFQCLEQAVLFKDKAQIRQVFEAGSTAAKSVTVGSWRSHCVLETMSFAAARTALTQALHQPNGFHRELAVRDALAAYRAAGKGPVMQKFYDEIDRARDPFDHFDMMAAASYAEAFLDNDPLVRAAEVVLAGENPPSAHELRDELFDQQQRYLVELRRIRRDRGKR